MIAFYKNFKRVTSTAAYQACELTFCWIVTIFLTTTFFLPEFKVHWIYQLVLGSVVVYYAGRNYFVSAAKDLVKSHGLFIAAIVVLSTQVCFIYSVYLIIESHVTSTALPQLYFVEAVSIITYIRSGDLVTDLLQGKIQKRVDGIKGINITEVLFITNMKSLTYKTLNIKEVKIGDKLLVKGGTTTPLDGRCYSYDSVLLNESSTRTPKTKPL